MPVWVLTVFAGMAAAVPAGVYFTATFMGYSYTGNGTGPAFAAPGPLLGTGAIPALLAVGAAYWAARRSRRRSAGK